MFLTSIILGCIICALGSSEFNFDFGKHDGLAVVTHIQSNRSDLDVGMPDSLNITIDILSKSQRTLDLYLIRNKEDIEIKPFFVVRETSDGQPTVVTDDVPIEENVALYQSEDGSASFTVTCEGLEYGLCKPIVLGSVNINGTEFDMKPTTDGGDSRLYNIYNRKQPDGEGKYCTSGENQEIAAISTAFKKQVKDTDFEGVAMRNSFRFAHPGTTGFGGHSSFRNRQHRHSGAANSYAAGLLVMVDDLIYKRFYGKSKGYTHYQKDMDAKALIRQYFAHTVNAMDMRYHNLRHPVYDIRIIVSGYLIDDNYLIDIWNDPAEAEVEEVMLRAIRWRKDMVSELPPHDHLMIFTGRDLYTKFANDYSVTGFASLDSICRQDSVSIIEDKGGFDCIITATHELGHSLGARHDGDRNICTPHDKYIMTSVGGDVTMHTRLNPFKFSECSKSYFLDRLQTLSNQGYNCLSIRKSYYNAREFARLTSVSTGQVFNANKQCQMKLGDDSYYGWGGNLGSFRDICTHMACKSNKTATSYNLYNAARGTSCGNRMWCINGECVYDQKAPSKEETCIHGDSLRSFAAYHSCAHLVASDPYKCMDRYYRKFCCESCKPYNWNTLSGVNPRRVNARFVTIPVVPRMQRFLPNTFSPRGFHGQFQNGQAPRHVQKQDVLPLLTVSGIDNNFNTPDVHTRNPKNMNTLRVFEIPKPAGSQRSDESNRISSPSFPMHPRLQPLNVQPPIQQPDNSITLPDHQRLEIVPSHTASNKLSTDMNTPQLPSVSLSTQELATFRNLIMRTLQLLARTGSQQYQHSSKRLESSGQTGNEQYGSNNQFFGMQDKLRNREELPTPVTPTDIQSHKIGTTLQTPMESSPSFSHPRIENLGIKIASISRNNQNDLSKQLSNFAEEKQNNQNQIASGISDSSIPMKSGPVIAPWLK